MLDAHVGSLWTYSLSGRSHANGDPSVVVGVFRCTSHLEPRQIKRDAEHDGFVAVERYVTFHFLRTTHAVGEITSVMTLDTYARDDLHLSSAGHAQWDPCSLVTVTAALELLASSGLELE